MAGNCDSAGFAFTFGKVRARAQQRFEVDRFEFESRVQSVVLVGFEKTVDESNEFAVAGLQDFDDFTLLVADFTDAAVQQEFEHPACAEKRHVHVMGERLREVLDGFELQAGLFVTGAFDGVANRAEQRLRGNTLLGDVVLRTTLHGLDGKFVGLVSRQNHDGYVRRVGMQSVECRHAFAVGDV